MYNDALQTSLNSTGELQRQQDIYMESAEAHLQQLRTEAEKIYATIFDQETAKDFIDVMNGALSVLNSYLQGLGGGMQTLTTLGLQAANIFSKQISGGISRQIQNREITKNTAAAGESKEALAEYLYGDNFDNLSSETRERVTAEYEVYDRIRDVASEITDEEYQRLVKMQEEYGVLAKQYEIAKKTKEEILASKDVQPYVEKGKNVIKSRK